MSEQVHIAVDSALCHDAEAIFEEMGFSTSGAVETFFQQVIREGTIPAAYRVPNAKTLAAMREIEEDDLPSASTVEELMRMLNAED